MLSPFPQDGDGVLVLNQTLVSQRPLQDRRGTARAQSEPGPTPLLAPLARPLELKLTSSDASLCNALVGLSWQDPPAFGRGFGPQSPFCSTFLVYLGPGHGGQSGPPQGLRPHGRRPITCPIRFPFRT